MMRDYSGSALALALAIVMSAFLTPAPARALMMVEESTAPDHPQGAKIDDEAVLNVPEGAKLRLFLTQSGQSYVVRGPHSGTLAAYRKKRSTWWRRVFGRFWSEPGESDGPPGGGVRSVDPK